MWMILSDSMWMILSDSMWMILSDSMWMILSDSMWMILSDSMWMILSDSMWMILSDSMWMILSDSMWMRQEKCSYHCWRHSLLQSVHDWPSSPVLYLRRTPGVSCVHFQAPCHTPSANWTKKEHHIAHHGPLMHLITSLQQGFNYREYMYLLACILNLRSNKTTSNKTTYTTPMGHVLCLHSN